MGIYFRTVIRKSFPLQWIRNNSFIYEWEKEKIRKDSYLINLQKYHHIRPNHQVIQRDQIFLTLSIRPYQPSRLAGPLRGI